MRYVIGIDGGGTKTVCAIADENGKILNVKAGNGTNHQLCGFETAIKRLVRLITKTLETTRLSLVDIRCIYLGLSGADFDSDVKKLEDAIRSNFPDMRIKVVNDIMLAFATEIHEGWGAVSICGTGHNAAVITPEGKVFGILALKEMLGNWGGGRHLADQAMHRAFRSFQKTGAYTRLEEFLPEICGVKDMNELAYAIYSSNYKYHYRFPIPSLVFQLAEEGDIVCRQLIHNMGVEMAEIMKGLLNKANFSEKTVPIALGGSLFCCENNTLLINSYREGLADAALEFDFRILKRPPVMGAVLLALKDIGIQPDKNLVSAISENLTPFSYHINDGGA